MMDKNRKILLMDILQGAVVIFLVGWLCYRNLIASLAGMVVLPVFIRFKAKKRVNQRQTRLWKEFKDVTAMMYSSTAAGGTLEKHSGTCERICLYLPVVIRFCCRNLKRYVFSWTGIFQ